MCIWPQLSIGPSLWVETFIPPRCRSPASAGAAATPSARMMGTNRLVLAPSFAKFLPPRSLLQQLHQVIGRFLVATHDRQLLDRHLLHLRVLLGPRDLDQRVGVVLDEETVQDRLAKLGVLLGVVDRDQRGAGLLLAHYAQLVDGLAAQLRARLGPRQLQDVIAVARHEEALEDRALDFGRSLAPVELPELRARPHRAQQADRRGAQLRVLLALRSRQDSLLVSGDHEALQDLLLDLGRRRGRGVDLRQQLEVGLPAVDSEVSERLLLDLGMAPVTRKVRD